MFLRGWFGDYLDDWFDPDEDAPPSSKGGVSRSLFLGTIAPRPVLPPWRQIKDIGAAGKMLTDIRNVLASVLTQDHVWGNHVDVTFTAAATPTKIPTGLGGPAKAYKIVRANADVRVWDAAPPSPSTERGIIWLQASAPATVTLFFY